MNFDYPPIVGDRSLKSQMLVVKSPPMEVDLNRVCYIAGPMHGYSEFNFPAFDAARDKLTSLGWSVLSPADLDRVNLDFDPTGMTGQERMPEHGEMYARQDITSLLIADAVFLLDGWEASKGANNEANIATMLGVPCFKFGTWERIELDAHFSNASTPEDEV